MSRKRSMDAIRLEIMWNRLISVVNEQAAALMRTSFTSIVREAGDLSAGVFDPRGNMIAQVREKRSLVDSDRAQVRVTELNIGQEVEQAYLVVNEAQERIAASQTAVASAQENFRLAQGRFDAGVGTILELTDAQLFLTQAQNTEAQALADYRVALASLERATGRR